MRMIKLITVVILLAGIGLAQQVPDAPSETKRQVYLAPLRSPTFYLGVGAFTASAIYDVHSTKVCEANRTCVEAYPGHDRYGYVMPLVGLVAAGTYGCELMFYQHKWWRRTICPGIGIGMSIVHWKDGSTIYHESRIARP